MAVLVTCASCKKSFRVKDELRASHIPCPHCRTDVTADGDRVPDHDVFISYAHKDKHVGDGICAVFEGRDVRCWIAPRDVPPGANWGASIVKAIKDSRMMVLVFSSSSNRSQQVLREVNAAVAAGAVIVPFRIEDVALSEDLEYYLSVPHWLDALTEPLDGHLKVLVGRARAILEQSGLPVWCEARALDDASRAPASDVREAKTSSVQSEPNPTSSSHGMPSSSQDLGERLRRLREHGEQKRAELEAAERRRKEEEFELFQGALAEQLDRKAFEEAWKTVCELRKLKPDDAEVQEAAKLIAEQLGHRGGGSVLVLPVGVTMEFVPIPPGTFLMGSPENEPGRMPNEGPQHQVTIGYPLWIGKYPVTQAQWQAVMGNNPSHFQGDLQRPVEMVSWNECQGFVQKVNAMGQGAFRLPSEAEWEYACRAGTQTRFQFGENEARLGEHGWYATNSGNMTQPVGQKKPNAWGLHDVLGNVCEWCQDWYHDTYVGAPQDGNARETPSGQYRVLRGGSSLYSKPVDFRSAYRGGTRPDGQFRGNGCRLVRTDSGEDRSEQSANVAQPERPRIEILSSARKAVEPSRKEFVLELPGAVTMEFVPISPGMFLMGSPENEVGRQPNESPQHQVTIAYPFWLGKYPVTQAQWQAMTGSSVTDQRNKMQAVHPTGLFVLNGQGPNHPMYYVSWHECHEFIHKINAMGVGAFRLPSEAEWEYACRAGTQNRFCFGDNDAQLGDYAWYEDNSRQTTHPVGQKKPNTWGLYDVHGHVREWCQDWSHDTYNGAPTDGSAWESPAGQYRVVRGGPLNCRCASRDGNRPGGCYFDLGFRLLRNDSSAAYSCHAVEVSQPEQPRIEIISSVPNGLERDRHQSVLRNNRE